MQVAPQALKEQTLSRPSKLTAKEAQCMEVPRDNTTPLAIHRVPLCSPLSFYRGIWHKGLNR